MGLAWSLLLNKLRGLWPWVLLLIAALLAGFGALKRAERVGAEGERRKQQRRLQEIREQWDEVDRRPSDFDNAIGRLRDRSR